MEQITIEQYLQSIKPIPVDIVGICDDPVCPNCGYYFWDYGPQIEVDCKCCPICKCRIDWARWHRLNDPEVTNENT